MRYADFSAVSLEEWRGVFDHTFNVADFNGECLVEDLVALPVEWVSEAFTRGEIFRVLDGSGVELGWLLTSRGQEFSYSAAAKQFVAAFLCDCMADEVFDENLQQRPATYQYKSHYFVTSSANFSRYVAEFRKGSGVWGGFLHPEECPALGAAGVWLGDIIASDDIALPNHQHIDVLRFGLRAGNSLDRFLHLYHLIEIGFDLSVVEELRALGADLRGVGKLIARLSQKELDRLVALLRNKCGISAAYYEERLKEVFSNPTYHAKLEEILFGYDKDGNPFREQKDRFMRVAALGFSSVSIKNEGLGWTGDTASKMVGYIIYRFRCCIAHARLGEHILGSDDDVFVFEVAEPLLRKILMEFYRG